MGRQNTKTIRIPFEQGILTNASGYEIGPRLRLLENLVYRYVSLGGDAKSTLAIPMVPSPGPALFPPGVNLGDMGALLGDLGESFYFVGGNEFTTAQRVVYNMDTGQEIVSNVNFGAGLSPSDRWSFAFAGNIVQPTTFCTRADGLAMGQIVLVAGVPTIQPYVPVFNPGVAGQLYYYLNRLWLGYRIAGRRSLIFFTDPLGTGIIRGNNFIDFPDSLVKMFRASSSDVDIGASSHLIFAGKSSISVLDGDPTSGNAVFRSLKRDIGVSFPAQVAEVGSGACFIGSNDQIYYLPPGVNQLIPIGQEVRDLIASNSPNQILGWRNPYLYFFIGTADLMMLCNLDDLMLGKSAEVQWSGIHHGMNNDHVVSAFLSDYPFEQNKNFVANDSPAGAAGIDLIVSVANNGDQRMRTGFIAPPDSDCAFWRIALDVQKDSSIKNFELLVFDNEGHSETKSFSVPAHSGSPFVEFHKESVTLAQHVRGDFFAMQLKALQPELGLENLRNWNVEYRVIPRKD